MQAIIDVKQAFEKRLIEAFPTIKVATEGVTFKPPEELYLRVQFRIDPPVDPVIGDKYYRERITMQVFVCDLLNKGTLPALQKAEEIRTLFDKGLFIQRNDTKIHVLRTPQISGATNAMDRIVVPVLIELIAEVYKN